MLGRLFLRTLPEEFTNNSIYSWFPLMTAAVIDEILMELDQRENDDFKRPERIQCTREFKEYGELSGVLTRTGSGIHS